MPRVLSEQDLEYLATELAAGRPPMVWFTSKAVGVEAGKSGKVTALDEPAEGEFIQVRPTGSQDVLSFSAAEVTLTKPARKPRKQEESEQPRAEKPSAPAPIEPVWTPEPAPEAKPRGAAKPRPSSENGESVTEPTGNRRSGAAKRAKPAAAATIVLNSTAEGLWTAEVTVGTKKALKPTTVSMAAVAQAVKILHPEADAAVQPVLDSARELQRAKVEQLQAELAEARRLLGDLEVVEGTDEAAESTESDRPAGSAAAEESTAAQAGAPESAETNQTEDARV